jgi:hypothetical protein
MICACNSRLRLQTIPIGLICVGYYELIICSYTLLWLFVIEHVLIYPYNINKLHFTSYLVWPKIFIIYAPKWPCNYWTVIGEGGVGHVVTYEVIQITLISMVHQFNYCTRPYIQCIMHIKEWENNLYLMDTKVQFLECVTPTTLMGQKTLRQFITNLWQGMWACKRHKPFLGESVVGIIMLSYCTFG